MKSKDARTIEQALADTLTDGGDQSLSAEPSTLPTRPSNSTGTLSSKSAVVRAASNATEVELRRQPSIHYSGMLGVEDNETRMDEGAFQHCLSSSMLTSAIDHEGLGFFA